MFRRFSILVLTSFLSLLALTEEGTVRKHRDLKIPQTKEKGIDGSSIKPGSGKVAPTKSNPGEGETIRSFRKNSDGIEGDGGEAGKDEWSKNSAGNKANVSSDGLGKQICEHQHPIETFVQISSAQSAQSSRQGGVYFLSDLREVNQVFYLEQPLQWPRQISFFPDGVPYFRVSPDGEKILLATHVGGNEQYDIHLFTVRDKKTIPLVVDPEERVESVFWEPGSRWFAYTSNKRNKVDFDLYQFDLASGKSTLLAELTGLNFLSDISPNGNLIAFTNYRAITDSDVRYYDRTKKAVVPFTDTLGKGASHLGQFTRSSESILFITDLYSDHSQLYRMKLGQSGAPQAISHDSWEVEDFQFNRERNQLIYKLNEDGYSRLQGYEVDRSGQAQKPLSLPKPDRSLMGDISFSASRSGTSFFFSGSSATRNADIWFWQNGQKRQWTASTHGQIDPACFSKEELIHYPSFDKLSIPAYLYRPARLTGPKKAIPFILYIHGGPEAQFRPQFSRIFQYFLERGYGILAPNVRGSSGYGKKYVSLDNYKSRMDSVQDAVEAAKWLIKEGHTTPSLLAINGGSYGGFMVLRTIQVAPELFSAASESVGISNFVSFLKNTKPYRRKLREVEYGPLEDEAFLKSISPMSYLDRIRTPLMIFHGANDPRVPVSEAEQITGALKKKGIPVELKVFADEGHGNAKLRNVMEQARTMAHFFDKQLKVEE